MMHVIEYTTEGRVVLRDETRAIDPVAVVWMKGTETLRLRSGNDSLTLSKAQLLQLVGIGEQVGQDLQPGMGRDLRATFKTPDPTLPIIDPDIPRVKINIGLEVPSNWQNRLDMQFIVENEIQADRWNWNFVPVPGVEDAFPDQRPVRPVEQDFSDN